MASPRGLFLALDIIMRIRFVHLALCAGALASSSFAFVPVSVIDDKAAILTRQSLLFGQEVSHTICVTRPPATKSYTPGRLSVDLWSIKPFFNVAIAVDPAEGGKECFSLSLDRSEADRFQITIIDQTPSAPFHRFFSGKIEAIPEKRDPNL